MKSNPTILPTAIALLALFAFLAIPVEGIIPLDNTCSFGSNYIQMVGFACIAAEEEIRDPTWTGRWRVHGTYQMSAFRIINKKMNEIGIDIGGTKYCSNFTIVNSGCSGDKTPGNYPRQISAEWVARSDFIFADYGTTLSQPNIMEAEAAGKIIFIPMSSSSLLFRCRTEWASLQPECSMAGAKRFPHAYSMLIPGEFQMNPVVTMYKLAGAKNIVFWGENDLFPQIIGMGVMSFASYSGLALTNYTVPKGPTQADMAALVTKIKDLKPDAVVSAAYADACPKFYSELRAQNYVPGGNAQTDCIGEPSSRSLPDTIYGIDKTEYDRRMTGPQWTDDFWFPPVDGVLSPQRFYDEMVSQGVSHWSIAMTSAAGLVLHKVIERAGSIDPNAIRAQLATFNEPTFAGQVGFSAWGQNNVKDVILLQSDANQELQIVYPLGSATANLVFPAPTFDERVFTPKYMGKVSEQVLAGVAGFLILVSLVLIGFIIIFRHNKMLISASPLFLSTILVGSIMLYGSYFTWVLEARTATCYLRFWLIGVGFVVMFGALFAKTWRIMRIFTTTDLRIFQITNTNLIAVLGILVGIEVALLAIWSGTSRPHQTVFVADPLRPSKNLLVCTNGKSGTAMLGILVAFKLAMVLYGIYMSIRIWKIPLKQFNESRSIAFSMYNMLCFGVLAFGLQVSKSINDPAMFMVRSICLMISTFFTVVAIFGPKLIQVYHGRTGYSSNGSTGKTTTGLTNFSKGSKGTARSNGTHRSSRNESSAVAQEDTGAALETVEAELQALKKRYAALKKKYRQLQPAGEEEPSV